MKVAPIVVILFASSIVCGQTSKPTVAFMLDSLKSELKLARNDTLRARLLQLLASSYIKTNPDSAIHYGEKAIEIARNINNKMTAVTVLGFIGDAYHSKGNLPKGLEVCLEAIDLNEELHGSPENRAGPAYHVLGDIYTDLGNHRQALFFYNRLLELPFPDYAKSLTYGLGYFGRAKVYEKMNMLDSALLELELSKIYFSESRGGISNRYPAIYPVPPNWFNLRASVYVKQGKIELALKDLNTTLNMTLKNDEPYYTSNSYNDIAGLYASLNSRDSAIYFAKKGLQEANRISYIGGMLVASEILAEQLDSVNDTEALHYLKLANRMRNQLYGASNIQLMKDMIAQKEKRQQEIANAEAAYQNKLKVNGLLGLAVILTIITVFLIRNNRNKQKAKRIIESAYADLKSTQSQLIQSEKMASLGELTAGIAHEIQNPLNFVNNFSEVNSELIDEADSEIDKGNISEVKTILNNIKENEEKINHHGKRADSIVKNMLQHSRSSSSKKELSDINKLADEYLRLSYHGFRAKDKSFNVTMKTDFDETIGKINIIPQDMGRVLLNLYNNAFYALAEKKKQQGESYEPTISISTEKINDKVAMTVSDNGNGIPQNIVDKIFQPFFSTKPTGQGTGLGLSLSYDIVQAHGGGIKVETKEGEGSILTIHLPSS